MRKPALWIRETLRRNARRVGFDVVRYPLSDPLARTVRLLNHHQVECLVDVGANNGGFASSVRQLGFNGRMVSFEPLSAPYRSLQEKAESDGRWDAVRAAVGDVKNEVRVNISRNSALSSSVLPMMEAHLRAAPESAYVGSELVRQDRLENLLSESEIPRNTRTFLKVDVQGYEGAVLEGAAGLFADKSIVGMQLEISFVPLYEGAMTYRETFDFADQQGMMLMGLDPVFADAETGQLLQADAVFFARDQ